MVKENEMPHKKRVYATIREDSVEWIEAKVEKRIYHNRSHAIEVLVRNEMEKKE